MKEIDRVCYQNASLVLEQPLEDLLKDFFPHVGIKGGDWVVH